MVFTAPTWVPSLPDSPPDSIPIHQFLLEPEYGRCGLETSKDSFTCAITKESRSVPEIKTRVERLAKGLAKDLGWSPNAGTQKEKVVCVYSLNHIDYMVSTWAVHRLNGMCSLSSAAGKLPELTTQMLQSGAKAIFTSTILLPVALQAAEKVNIPKQHVYVLDSPDPSLGVTARSVEGLVAEGKGQPDLEPIDWQPGQGSRQVAYLCFSSGTSGSPKAVKISHQNVIANVLQACVFDGVGRSLQEKNTGNSVYTETCMGMLPMSHAFTLIMCMGSLYRGDGIIILPSVDLPAYFKAIAEFKVRTFWVVPALINVLIKAQAIAKQFDVSSITDIVCGADMLREDAANDLKQVFPNWRIRHGYGLTEASTILSVTSRDDIMLGSVGSLLPNVEAKLISAEGAEITEHDVSGELLIKSPSVSMGYYHDEESTKQVYRDGWLHTGDVAMVRASPLGHEHLFIKDRIKDLIKVRGNQVSPTEIESFVLGIDGVAGCCVVPAYDRKLQEVPKAFVIASSTAEDKEALARDIQNRVKNHFADYKRLQGGVEFVDDIPRNQSGKILRRHFRAEVPANKPAAQ